jgi:hypothetical protein
VRLSRKHGQVVPGILCAVEPESGSKSFLPRRARPDEARTIADVWLRSRYASIPAIPHPAHTDDEVRDWFASVLVSEREVWVIAPGECPVALLVLEREWINQLYVDRHGRGKDSVRFSSTSQRSSIPSTSTYGRSRATPPLDASTSATVS